MYTSEKDLKLNLRWHLIAAGFLAVFGGIYELFSHGVYSGWMIFAFTVPLFLGALPYALLLHLNRTPGKAFRNLWNAGIACLSVGSVFQGVLVIYGTTNSLIIAYPIAGSILMLLGIVSECLHLPQNTAFWRLKKGKD